MLFPTIKQLTPNKQSCYSLVIATAKRARQIAEKAENEGIALSDKPVKLAVKEMAEGKVTFREVSQG